MIEIEYITGYSPNQESIYRYLLIPTHRIYGNNCMWYFYVNMGDYNNARGYRHVRIDLMEKRAMSFKRIKVGKLLQNIKLVSPPRPDNLKYDLSCKCKILKKELVLLTNEQFRNLAFSLIFTVPHLNTDEQYIKEQEYLQELLTNYPDEN